MSWRVFGYFCCLTSGFNFIVFQVITAHLSGDRQNIAILPQRIPTAHTACIACSILHLIAMLISLAYLRGYIKFDPFALSMRYLRSTAGLSPVSGPMRYRKITENDAAVPECSEDVETDNESNDSR
ncbi:uncharacterized protein BXIN_1228 [Babesia sp. Xinjiang]|uniref:uncharacterized protein n=1 Tax=Babesia sp. Xinjiang TaxID=462227 RepID=UPI000A230072|nr:uncharacterized protein BXIN_1228 [Babesia sp. Xinjiang]ORM40189.1 hypothetical protein BXIN_1228 [Babesia sp. Xinjiang]